MSNLATNQLPTIKRRLKLFLNGLLPDEQTAGLRSIDETLDLLERIKPRLRSVADYESRLTGTIGKKQFFLHPRDIAFFQADNKIVFIITLDGTRYIHNQKLEHLEKFLDPRDFFRINRSVIVHSQAIEHVRPHINSRIKIILKAGCSPGEFIVSRDRVSAFRNWANC